MDNGRLDRCPLRAHPVRTPPSAVSGSLASCGWSGRPSPSWSPLLGGRQPLRCQSGLAVGRRGSGRPPPWCRHGGLLPAGTCWTLWQIGGDCNAIARALAAQVCSRLSSPFPGPRGSGGHTCRTLLRTGSASASRIGFDREGAHGRVYSDRAVDHSRCEADQTSGIASPRGSLARLSSQVRTVGAVGFQTRSGQQAARPVGSAALVVRSRPLRPGSTSRTRGNPRGRPTPLPRGQSCVLLYCPRTCWHRLILGSGCTGACAACSVDRGSRTRWTPVKKKKVPLGINPRAAPLTKSAKAGRDTT